MARNVRFELRRGAGSPLEVLFGKVSLTPTMQHSVSTSVVLPAPTTFDLINGVAVATNVAPSPAPVEGMVEWAYIVKIVDTHGKSFEYMVGVPDGTTEINFNALPKYFETKPPLFGAGPQGIPGSAATVTVGTVSSGPTPAVTNTGTSTEAVLNFTLAQGPAGPTGTGVPAGGTALQVVRKTADNLTTEWATADKTLVGLGNVDNTSDANKPVSTAQATAIAAAEGRTDTKIVGLDDKFASKGSAPLNVKDFGATGDGVTDDFAAIRLAVDEANLTGKTVLFPQGTYYTAYKDPTLEANQIVIDGSGVSLVGENAVLENFLIYVKGGYGAPLNIAADLPIGGRDVSTTVAHGFAVGNYVQLLSCVNGYTTDGGEWQLGSASPTDGNQPIARYTEIQEIASLTSTTAVSLVSDIIYPTYKATTTGLNYPISGITSSQIRVLHMVKDVSFKGITFRSLNNSNGRGITVRAAANLKFEECRFESGSVAGSQFKMTDSYNVRFINCTSRKSLGTFSGSSWNTFFVGGGCQSVYFEGCDFSGEAQTIDFTPNNFTSAADIGGAPDGVASMSTMQLFGVYESTFNGCSDGVTSHPATYMFEVSNCFFNGGSVGVRARSRASIVRDNTIHTGRGGVALSAFVSDSLVSGNTIVQKVSAKYSGFYTGIAYNATSSEIMSDNAVRNLIITENSIKITTTNAVNSGIMLMHYDPPVHLIDEATKVRRSEITIANNRLRKASIVVDKWINGTLIQANVFGGGSDRAYYITTQPESAANQIVENTFLDSTPTVQTGAVTLTGHGYATQHRVALQKGTTGLGATALVNTATVFGYSGILWDALEVGNGGKLSAARAAGAATLNIDAVASDNTSAVTVNVFNGNTTTGQKLFKVAGRTMADDFQIGFGSRLHGGTGSPEGVVSAPQGSLFLRTDGGAGTSMYVKQTGGTGNTGWVGK